MIEVTPYISLSDNEIEEKFIRSPGAGGQKVNKTATSVQMRFNAKKSSALTSDLFLRLNTVNKHKMISIPVCKIPKYLTNI